MPSPLLIDYLNRCRANYQLSEHEPALTAASAALLHRVPLRQFAKPVLIRADGALAMVIVPAHCRLALDSLRHALRAGHVELAQERQFQHRFPRCELGAMPPFGHLFGLNAYAAPLFADDCEILFKAGSHSESVRMPYHEFRRLAHFDVIDEGVVPQLRKPTACPTRLRKVVVGPAVPAPFRELPMRPPLLALQGR